MEDGKRWSTGPSGKDEVLTLKFPGELGQLAQETFDAFVREWRPRLPRSAEFEHVGATAIPDCLTKGDLDICIRIDPGEFEEAEACLAERFERNSGSFRSHAFAAFKNDASTPPLGLQLVVKNSELDVFVKFRDRLLQESGLVQTYNDLKKQYAGRPMETYRHAKSRFIQYCISGTDQKKD